jgi:alpha-L-fucosidase
MNERLNWWRTARLGMSLHLGPYSVPGRGEWLRSTERLSVAQYKRHVDALDLRPGCAREWARLAKAMGAGYVVLTTKHHDGFCLFDSQLTTYKYERDLVREYVEALRAEGLRVGLYYSLVDWHHPDYPATGDRQHPLRADPASPARDAQADWSRYLAYLHGQVRELCTNYGTIDLLVFDFSYWDFVDQTWGAAELVRDIRRLQPKVIFNDRMSREGIKRAQPPEWVGDFDHAEQNIPRDIVRNDLGQAIPWESWFTVSNSWAWNAHDRDFKSAATLVRALVNCVSKGGNLMINVGPDARGLVSEAQQAPLRELGRWLERNGESIRGAGPADLPKPEWGRWTQRDGFLYAHLTDQPIGHICLPGLRGQVADPVVVATNTEAILTDYWNPGVQTFDAPEDIFFNLHSNVAGTYPLPDSLDAVVRFRLIDGAEREAQLTHWRERFAAAMVRKPF